MPLTTYTTSDLTGIWACALSVPNFFLFRSNVAIQISTLDTWTAEVQLRHSSMRISFGSPMALVVATALIYFCRASAAISVSVDDLDPLKTCKRRDVRCKSSIRTCCDEFLLTISSDRKRQQSVHVWWALSDNKLNIRYLLNVNPPVGGQSWVKNGTEARML